MQKSQKDFKNQKWLLKRKKRLFKKKKKEKMQKKVKKTFKKAKKSKRLFKKQKCIKRLLKSKSFKICYGRSGQKTFEAMLRPVCSKNFWSQICAGTHSLTHRQVSQLYSSEIL